MSANEHRCDRYGITGLRGVEFCRKAGAQTVALKLRRLKRLEEALFNIAHLSRVCSVDDAIAAAREALR